MEPRDYAAALRKFWVLILLLAVAGGGAAYLYGQGTPPSYSATSKVFVTVESGQTVSELVQGSTFAENVVQSYSQLTTMPIVLNKVVSDLDLDVTARELAGQVSADTPLNTVIIEIRAVSGAPREAAAISNSVALNLARTVEDIAPRNADGESSVAVRVVEPAGVPLDPFAPNVRLLVATGLLLGAAIGVAVALVRQLLDTKVRTDKDVERVTDAAVLGSVARLKSGSEDKVVMLGRPRSAQAEAYRKIRANLQFVNAAVEIRSLVVTSARASEGKSTTVANLALAVAERGARVLLIDADLRRPTVSRVTGLEGAAGLTTVLIGDATFEEVVQDWGGSGVSVLTAGAAPPNPLQLLDSPAMAELLEEATAAYDLVLVDAPPVLPVADAAVLSRLTNGVLVVVGAGLTTRQQLRKVIESLGAVGANIVGVVIARAAKRDVAGAYGYGYLSDDGRNAWKPADVGNAVGELVSGRGAAKGAPDSSARESTAGSSARRETTTKTPTSR